MNKPARLTNWDLLRSLAMLFVVAVHSVSYLGPIHGCDTQSALTELFLICDPVFFCLSGYFALRPHKGDLGTYYLKKISGIILPIIVYAVLLFFWDVHQGSIDDFSLRGFAMYLNDQLSHGWWFIPALIPLLMLAPFLARMLDALDDDMFVALVKVVAVLAAWGCLSMFADSVLVSMQMTTKSALLESLMQLLPASLIPGSGYFVFFVMGYAVRRIAPNLSHRQTECVIGLGLAAWTCGTILAGLGFSRHDPSYWWLFSTFGIFIAFDRARITNQVASRAITWTAKRSYSIYLVQYTAIGLMKPVLYDMGLFGDVGALMAVQRIGIWCLLVGLSFLASLAAASIFDVSVLCFVQYCWKRAVLEPYRRHRQHKLGSHFAA